MSDRDANDLTISPHEARRSQTRIMRAIAETADKRAARREGASPTALFWLGIVRNFLLGIPFTGLGFVWAYRAGTRLEKHLTTESFAWHDLPPFIPAAIMLLVGVAFIAPGQTESALRFLGVGGIIDRLPFLKSKTP